MPAQRQLGRGNTETRNVTEASPGRRGVRPVAWTGGSYSEDRSLSRIFCNRAKSAGQTGHEANMRPPGFLQEERSQASSHPPGNMAC